MRIGRVEFGRQFKPETAKLLGCARCAWSAGELQTMQEEYERYRALVRDELMPAREAAEARAAELEAAMIGELCGDLTCARCAKFRDVLKGKGLNHADDS